MTYISLNYIDSSCDLDDKEHYTVILSCVVTCKEGTQLHCY